MCLGAFLGAIAATEYPRTNALTLTCEAVLNLPAPNIHQLSAQLRTMYDGAKPVTGRELASAFHLSENAIVPVLRRCEQRGMIRNIQYRGWIPAQPSDQ